MKFKGSVRCAHCNTFEKHSFVADKLISYTDYKCSNCGNISVLKMEVILEISSIKDNSFQ